MAGPMKMNIHERGNWHSTSDGRAKKTGRSPEPPHIRCTWNFRRSQQLRV